MKKYNKYVSINNSISKTKIPGWPGEIKQYIYDMPVFEKTEWKLRHTQHIIGKY